MGHSTRVSLRQSYRSAAKNMTTLLLTIIFFDMENPLTFWWEEEDKTLGHHRHNVMRISWPSESDTKQAQQINAIMKNERLYNVIWLLLKRMHLQRVLVTRVYSRWYRLTPAIKQLFDKCVNITQTIAKHQ